MTELEEQKKKKKPMRFQKVVVSLLLLTVLLFTICMIILFCATEFHQMPDSLITAFYGFAGSEALFLTLIKNTETKYDTDKPEEAGEIDEPNWDGGERE